MPRTSNRLGRISDQLKQELAQLIQNELRDPRLGMVSVLDVRVSRDLAHAEAAARRWARQIEVLALSDVLTTG